MSNWKHTIEGVDWASYKLWEREQIFKEVCKQNNVELEQAPYSILWEDPDDLDAPMKVTSPSPTWWAMALHGKILPPVSVYWALKDDEEKPDFKQHTRGYLLHNTQPLEAMTEEQAIEYLIMKDIPMRVWKDYNGNRQILKIIPRYMIPDDRSYRNAWKIKQTENVNNVAN